MTMTITKRLARYETAQETIGLLIADLAARMHKERNSDNSNQALIVQWKAEQSAFKAESDRLRFDDNHAIDRVINVYCPIVRALYAQ